MGLDTTKTLKKVSYNGQQFALDGEWQPDADMQWARQVFLDDVQEGYTYKLLCTARADEKTETIYIPNGGAVKTSDGAFYTRTEHGPSVTHTWNDENVHQSEVYDYNLRWAIYYRNETITSSLMKNIVHIIHDMNYELNIMSYYNIMYIEAINGGVNRIYGTSGNTYPLGHQRLLQYINNIELYYNAPNNPYNMGFLKGSYSLVKIDNDSLNTEEVTNFRAMFHGCSSLKNFPIFNTSSGTSFQEMFGQCSSLEEVTTIDTSNGTNFERTLYRCYALKKALLNTTNGTNFYETFGYCHSLNEVLGLNTINGNSFYGMFNECYSLSKIKTVDLRNATSVNNTFKNCYSLVDLDIRNINISLQIGSGSAAANTSYGTLLSLSSLLNTIKELWDNTEGTSTKTLTVGTANKTKLANVYVKLIDITDEMRAEDEFIDLKLPFVVCESTDEGAMLITDYATSKNWTIA